MCTTARVLALVRMHVMPGPSRQTTGPEKAHRSLAVRFSATDHDLPRAPLTRSRCSGAPSAASAAVSYTHLTLPTILLV